MKILKTFAFINDLKDTLYKETFMTILVHFYNLQPLMFMIIDTF